MAPLADLALGHGTAAAARIRRSRPIPPGKGTPVAKPVDGAGTPWRRTDQASHG